MGRRTCGDCGMRCEPTAAEALGKASRARRGHCPGGAIHADRPRPRVRFETTP
ncbi:MAG: hypothetical protein QM608_19480 [Caulobacter sp.]